MAIEIPKEIFLVKTEPNGSTQVKAPTIRVATVKNPIGLKKRGKIRGLGARNLSTKTWRQEFGVSKLTEQSGDVGGDEKLSNLRPELGRFYYFFLAYVFNYFYTM